MSTNPNHELSPDDVGARVSVRYRLESGATDVVGDLEILDVDQLGIRRSDGSLVGISSAAVVAVRVVGPSLLSARELESVSASSWPAPDEEWLGRWWLRSAEGFTARANAVRPLGDPGRSLDDALAYVVGWYTERGQSAMIRAVGGSNVSAELDRRGWGSDRPAVFQTVTVARLRRSLAARSTSSAAQIAPRPPPSWLQRFEGGTATAAALDVLTGAPDVAFATINAADSSAPAVAIGRAAVDGPWVGFTAFEVDPSARRQGHANAVMSALTEWAASRRAVRGWLEVLASNDAALALYASLGFSQHHRYSYRTPPPLQVVE